MPDNKRKTGLGRGLSALMADVDTSEGATSVGQQATITLPIAKLSPNPDQPRRQFDALELEELASSIAEKGVIQPLIVRQYPAGSDTYQIVAGERRWRAAQKARLHELPVVIRDLDDTEVLELAIIENIQRSDLNAIEEALGYKQLKDRFGHTQEQLAQALGKSRSHIANLIRLLELPSAVIDFLNSGALTAGHARALLTARDPVGLAKKVISDGLSVRQTERLVKNEVDPAKKRIDTLGQANEKDADTKALEADLSAATGAKVSIDHSVDGETGKVVITYKSLEQLDWLCQALSRGPR